MLAVHFWRLFGQIYTPLTDSPGAELGNFSVPTKNSGPGGRSNHLLANGTLRLCFVQNPRPILFSLATPSLGSNWSLFGASVTADRRNPYLRQ